MYQNRRPVIDTISKADWFLLQKQNVITLNCYAEGTTNVRGTFRLPNATSGYQVPIGKKFKIFMVEARGILSSLSTVRAAQISYADNDVGIASATAFTNQKFLGDNSNLGYVYWRYPTINSSNIIQVCSFDFEIPAQKYIGFQIISAGLVSCPIIIYGLELNA